MYYKRYDSYYTKQGGNSKNSGPCFVLSDDINGLALVKNRYAQMVCRVAYRQSDLAFAKSIYA
ncbi:MAG: hypothetical protein A2W90_00060 [Bacteroidetes bacterium GWF2_42_66]|nr:MAG: hypothetical protein A2W92_09240 [Bacteroidetes bacterium GWA2_42_15]OFX97898.1 MAG: hypothetical protein A2W89_07525 [Bacteroidetes bacterium GWE2_42_39]OFY44125.1 MAG: hypothetical protein A2W90_00060 [Bacteroidetes bacterium GWF2_42_66]HBL74633.1 hypothetical protein [Prolixibacteraceae bacterium]HCU60860.1 hypothetical protein [Prolixibacteraceae bacterium]